MLCEHVCSQDVNENPPVPTDIHALAAALYKDLGVYDGTVNVRPLSNNVGQRLLVWVSDRGILLKTVPTAYKGVEVIVERRPSIEAF